MAVLKGLRAMRYKHQLVFFIRLTCHNQYPAKQLVLTGLMEHVNSRGSVTERLSGTDVIGDNVGGVFMDKVV